jgi:hypothetical protein
MRSWYILSGPIARLRPGFKIFRTKQGLGFVGVRRVAKGLALIIMVSSMGVPLGSGISPKILSRKTAIRIFLGSGRSSTKRISSLRRR